MAERDQQAQGSAYGAADYRGPTQLQGIDEADGEPDHRIYGVVDVGVVAVAVARYVDGVHAERLAQAWILSRQATTDAPRPCRS